MASEASVFGLSTLGVIVGLAVLLWGTELGHFTIVTAGGVIVLLAVAVMTVYLSGMEGPSSGH